MSTDSKRKPVKDSILNEVRKAVVGQDEVIELLLISLAAGGHSIIQGVPGLAKTLLVQALARSLDLEFRRIQFTPDMVPSDITGTEILDMGAGEKSFRFIEGPVFGNIILADEINRTPPKTQSALLEAMQEKRVTILGRTYSLPDPFYVFATQNPIEYEGTYPLPEAQLDRFLFHIEIGYPGEDEELAILDADPARVADIKPVVTRGGINTLIDDASRIPVSEKVRQYVLSLVRLSRPGLDAPAAVRDYVQWGAGPRAGQMLLRAAKAHALLNNSKIADKESVDRVFIPALRHRIILNYRAASDNAGVTGVLEAVKKHAEAML